ncbi:MAG TPA: hypothetical protein VFX51_18120 [Solirubrobacteraceae bacterium]|nr:hypothetical protein [Solirubrobacteraceae bacterium]
MARPRALLLIAAAAVAGCGSDPRPPATVDERAGTYRGVGIGSTRAEARRELGRLESGATDPLVPIGADGDELGIPPSPQDPGRIAIWRFDDAVMAAGRGEAWLLSVAAEDAFTREGVGVGSSLDDVREAYPDADCATANEGTEYTQFDYCTLRVAPRRYLWFGSDPVRSLTMSREPLR